MKPNNLDKYLKALTILVFALLIAVIILGGILYGRESNQD